MGVPTSEVGYTSAMPRREDHEVHKDMWEHWEKKFLISELQRSRNASCVQVCRTQELLRPHIK